MSVSLTVSETISGSAVADSLAGGGTGVDLGSVVNNSYGPITLKADNTGRQNLFVRHDAVTDPITDVKTFMQQFGTGTGFTYGGASTAALDYTSLKSLANASGNSKSSPEITFVTVFLAKLTSLFSAILNSRQNRLTTLFRKKD